MKLKKYTIVQHYLPRPVINGMDNPPTEACRATVLRHQHRLYCTSAGSPVTPAKKER